MLAGLICWRSHGRGSWGRRFLTRFGNGAARRRACDCWRAVLGRACGCRSSRANRADHLADANILSLALDDLLQHAALLGRDFDIDFVGLQIDQHLAGRNRVADLLQPLADGRLDN